MTPLERLRLRTDIASVDAGAPTSSRIAGAWPTPPRRSHAAGGDRPAVVVSSSTSVIPISRITIADSGHGAVLRERLHVPSFPSLVFIEGLARWRRCSRACSRGPPYLDALASLEPRRERPAPAIIPDGRGPPTGQTPAARAAFDPHASRLRFPIGRCRRLASVALPRRGGDALRAPINPVGLDRSTTPADEARGAVGTFSARRGSIVVQGAARLRGSETSLPGVYRDAHRVETATRVALPHGVSAVPAKSVARRDDTGPLARGADRGPAAARADNAQRFSRSSGIGVAALDPAAPDRRQPLAFLPLNDADATYLSRRSGWGPCGGVAGLGRAASQPRHGARTGPCSTSTPRDGLSSSSTRSRSAACPPRSSPLCRSRGLRRLAALLGASS